MSGMTTTEWQGTPADVAVERTAVLAEAGDSTLLTVYEQIASEHAETEAQRWQLPPEGTGVSPPTWVALTYRQVRERVRDAALGLSAAGFQPGEFAVIWSGNRSEATIADYAVMHARGVPVFLYNTLAP